MDLSLFLAQWWGVLLVVLGVSSIIRHESIRRLIAHLAGERPSPSYLIGYVEFILGTTLVLLYTEWTPDWRGIVTLFNWLVFLEGATYILFPSSVFSWVVKTFNTNVWYYVAGSASVLLGAYLAGVGFGLI